MSRSVAGFEDKISGFLLTPDYPITCTNEDKTSGEDLELKQAMELTKK